MEHGRRGKGVLVSATPGFDSAFSAAWVTMLVPTASATPMLDGPVWSGEEAGRSQAAAIAALPAYRNGFYLGLNGGSARFRFREAAVWILGTDPLVVGLPAGEPRRTWREFAVAETGVKDAEHASPVAPLVVRFVVPRELDQPLARVAVFPKDFWNRERSGDASVLLSVVTLPRTMSIGEVLDALTAAAGEPTRLGTVETVALHEEFPSPKENAKSPIADRERLREH